MRTVTHAALYTAALLTALATTACGSDDAGATGTSRTGVLYSRLDDPMGIAVDVGRVYWGNCGGGCLWVDEGGNVGLYAGGKDGGGTQGALVAGAHNVDRVALGNGYVFYTDNLNHSAYAVPASGGDPILLTKSGPAALASDGTEAFVVETHPLDHNCTNTQIVAFDPTKSGSRRVVASGLDCITDIVVDGTDVYAAATDEQGKQTTLSQIPKAGGVPETIARIDDEVQGLALAGGMVTVLSHHKVYQVPASGGIPTEIVGADHATQVAAFGDDVVVGIYNVASPAAIARISGGVLAEPVALPDETLDAVINGMTSNDGYVYWTSQGLGGPLEGAVGRTKL